MSAETVIDVVGATPLVRLEIEEHTSELQSH